MKRLLLILTTVLMSLLASGCTSAQGTDQIAATTLPVYEFASRLCTGTDITVSRLITENVSCLHDYTLQVSQMRAVEGANAVILSGAGLEEFLEDALDRAQHTIDASEGLALPESPHEHEHDHGHIHETDPHIWLSPANAAIMAQNICKGLSDLFPEHKTTFQKNLADLLTDLDALQRYGQETLSTLSCRDLITFHDGFSYFAESFNLSLLKAVEEESGSEASAAELIELIRLVDNNNIPAIFTETNGSTSAANIISAECDVRVYTLDMCMSGDSYFSAMYRNIDTIWEAMQ